jgi:hypothetical protein
MPYRISIAGILVEMDTPDELSELLKRSDSAKVLGPPSEGIEGNWDLPLAKRLFDLTRGQGRQYALLQRLYYAEAEWLSKPELVEKLALKSATELGGTLSGLAKNSRKLRAIQAVESEKKQLGGERVTVYRLTATLRMAIDAFLREESDSKFGDF